MHMKRFAVIFVILALLLALTGCTDGPLVATATPEPTPEVTPAPEPTPEPTPEPIFQEDVIWPETSLTMLLPHFKPTLEIMTQRGDEHFFASFTEYDSNVIEKYKEALLESGFTVVEQDGDGIYVVSHEDSDGLLTVQIYYEGGSGTIQITDKR